MSVITAVVLAAGAGRRLGDLGKLYSKPMVPLHGQPLVTWVMQRLADAGVQHTLVVAHGEDHQLAAHLARSHPQVTRVVQEQRRGIADALRLALPAVAAPGFLACACDSLFTVEDLRMMIRLGTARPLRAVVGVLEMGVAATSTRSAVRLDDDRVIEIVEKPAAGSAPSGLVAMPLYWLPSAIGASLDAAIPAQGEGYVTTALAAFLAGGGDVRACRLSGRLEVTTAADVAAVERLLPLPSAKA